SPPSVPPAEQPTKQPTKQPARQSAEPSRAEPSRPRPRPMTLALGGRPYSHEGHPNALGAGPAVGPPGARGRARDPAALAGRARRAGGRMGDRGMAASRPANG